MYKFFFHYSRVTRLDTLQNFTNPHVGIERTHYKYLSQIETSDRRLIYYYG